MSILAIPHYFKVENRKMRWMLYTLFCLMAADGLLTKFLVINGQAVEANPLMQSWVSQELFLALKISGAFLVTLFLWIKYNRKPGAIYLVAIVSLIFYTVIVFWNLSVFAFPLPK